MGIGSITVIQRPERMVIANWNILSEFRFHTEVIDILVVYRPTVAFPLETTHVSHMKPIRTVVIIVVIVSKG